MFRDSTCNILQASQYDFNHFSAASQVQTLVRILHFFSPFFLNAFFTTLQTQTQHTLTQNAASQSITQNESDDDNDDDEDDDDEDDDDDAEGTPPATQDADNPGLFRQFKDCKYIPFQIHCNSIGRPKL